MNWYIGVLKKYAVFSGRARRKEYWMFVLVSMSITIALVIIEKLIGISWLNLIYSLGILVPSIAVGVRRLHDTGRSGWWFLLALIPLIGGIVLLVFACLDSEEGENRFGPNPKAIAA